jgi:hypothetical protein
MLLARSETGISSQSAFFWHSTAITQMGRQNP